MPAKINYTFTPHYSLVESRATFETKNSLRKFRILPGFIGVDSWCVGFCFATVESIPVQKQLKIFFAPVFRLASSDQQLWFFSLLYGMANRWLICDQFQHLLTRLLSNLNEARTKVQPHKLGKNNYETNRIKRFFLQSIVSEITVVRLSSTRNTNQPTNDRTSERARRKHAHNFESRIHLYASWNSTRSWTVSQLRHTHTGKPEGEKRTN